MMSGKSGTQDWFYHAPSKHEDKQPVDYPAASQIPLIGGDLLGDPDRDDSGMKRGWLRETDSKYVRLAKMGGRKDLLTIRTPPPKMDSPRAYPRVDWFDHHNIEDEPADTSPRKVYLPDYMVHEAHDPAIPVVDTMADKRQKPRRPPFSLQDGISAFKRDGDMVTDKTVKLNEEVPHSKRFPKRERRSDVEQMNKALAARRESLTQRQKKTIKEPEEPLIFGKLLSMGYQQDWVDQRDRHTNQHRREDPAPGPATQQPYRTEAKGRIEPATTEYREVINRTGKQVQTLKGGNRKVDRTPAAKQERFNTTGPQVTSRCSPSAHSNNSGYQQQLHMTKVEI